MTIQANQGFGVSIFGATSAGGGGSTSPGGSSGQLQYNASGSFGGMAGTSWDDTNRALTLTGATVTTSQPVLNLSQTWNAGAVTFTGLKFNATDTASAAGSLLLDLQTNTGGAPTSRFQVTKLGSVIVGPNGSFTALNSSGASVIQASPNASYGFHMARGYAVSWGSNTSLDGSIDLSLTRDAANTLALRNSTNPQTFRVYNGADTTNFQRLTLSAGVTANMAVVAADNGGTGIAMGLQFGAALTTGGGVTNIFNINTSGNLVWNTDNTYDIGASGASRPRSVYAGTSVYAGAAGALGFAGRSLIQSASDGVIRLLNNATTDFNRLQFGGTTSSYPALKRSSASLICRLADDSANAAFEALSLKTDAPAGGTSGTWKLGVRVAATTTLDTTQYIEVDVGGTLYKLAVVTS